jgi:small GTP-binding protein
LQIWDTAGDYKLRDLVSLYYRNSHAAVLVFDITQEETKENLQDWLAELEDRCQLEDVSIKVAANKFDIFEGKIF